MAWVRSLAFIGAILLAGLIFWASETAGQSLSEALTMLVSEPWSVVTLFDLYLGFFLISVMIWTLEQDRRIALLFILPLPFLGNAWAALWVGWRLSDKLREQLPAKSKDAE